MAHATCFRESPATQRRQACWISYGWYMPNQALTLKACMHDDDCPTNESFARILAVNLTIIVHGMPGAAGSGLVEQDYVSLPRLASQSSSVMKHLSSLSHAGDVVRDLAQSLSNGSLEAGFRAMKLTATCHVKGTYALKGIPGNSILSGIMPQQLADSTQMILSNR